MAATAATAVAWLAGAAFAGLAEDNQISRLISQGKVLEAKAVLESTNPSEADKVFFVARVFKASGRLAKAIEGFRRVIELDPKNINARRELAHTLLLAKDFDGAEAQFKRLNAVDPSAEMRQGYDRFLGVIRQNKPYGFSGHFAVLPSTNINRGTDRSIFDAALGSFVIDPASQSQSGVGVEVGVSGFARQDLGDGQRLLLEASVSGQKYTNAGYDSVSGSLSARFDQKADWGGWFVNPFFNVALRADAGDVYAPGVRVGADIRLSEQDRLSVVASHEVRFFPEASYRDGAFTSAVASLSHQVDPSLVFSLGYAYERARPEAAHLQYDGRKGFARATKGWDGGLITGFGVEAGTRGFVGDFPLTAGPREDSFYKVDAALSHREISVMGFTPKLGCSYTVNASNIAFYDYDAADCRVGLTRDF